MGRKIQENCDFYIESINHNQTDGKEDFIILHLEEIIENDKKVIKIKEKIEEILEDGIIEMLRLKISKNIISSIPMILKTDSDGNQNLFMGQKIMLTKDELERFEFILK